MGIRIERPGQFTTVQDEGRYGFQRYGFGVTGVMDHTSFRLANLILGNPAGQSMLEFTIVGPRIRATETVWAVLTGDFEASQNGRAVPCYQAFCLEGGDVLDIKTARVGNYGYLAFSKAFDIPRVMGSDSTNVKSRVGGLKGRILTAGDELSFRTGSSDRDCRGRGLEGADLAALWPGETAAELRVVLGPQADAFTARGIDTFLHSVYTLSNQTDRMGYRMTGPVIEHTAGADIISDGTVFGVVQVPADGNPIILMADRQTTGGYTKIATVISLDLPKLVQGRPGTEFRFCAVSVGEAQALLWEREHEFKQLEERILSLHQPTGRGAARRIEALLTGSTGKDERRS